jgi:hypothetical protein
LEGITAEGVGQMKRVASPRLVFALKGRLEQ